MLKSLEIKNFKLKKGFTFVEMMVSIGIITLLSIMVLAYNRRAETINNLVRSANKLVFELQRIQNQAMLVYQKEGEEGGSSEKICGWGMYFGNALSPEKTEKIFSFVDLCQNKDHKYTSEEEKRESINLMKNTEIFETNVNSIVFVPPEPRVYFNPSDVNFAYIKIKLENQTSLYPYYEIKVTKGGQIYKNLVIQQQSQQP